MLSSDLCAEFWDLSLFKGHRAWIFQKLMMMMKNVQKDGTLGGPKFELPWRRIPPYLCISPQIHPQNVNVFSCCIYKCSRRRMESRRRNQKLMINIVGFFSRYTYELLISSVKQVPHEVGAWSPLRCKDPARACKTIRQPAVGQLVGQVQW